MGLTRWRGSWKIDGNVDILGDVTANRVLPGGNLGKHYYVNTVSGALGNDGKKWNRAFKTMAAALAVAANYDVIHVAGRVREQLSTPNSVSDVTIIGEGNNARHSDDTFTGAARWDAPAVPAATTPLLIIRGQGWRISNILFSAPVDTAAIRLLRDGETPEHDASHAVIDNCRFAGGLYGIDNVGGAGHWYAVNNRFYDLVTAGAAAIKCTNTAIAIPLRVVIAGNIFSNNVNHILHSFNDSEVIHNILHEVGTSVTVTVMIDTKNVSAQGKDNVVAHNVFQGYNAAGVATPDFIGATTDSWVNNYCDDAADYGVPA
jgi:hypothetical protein